MNRLRKEDRRMASHRIIRTLSDAQPRISHDIFYNTVNTVRYLTIDVSKNRRYSIFKKTESVEQTSNRIREVLDLNQDGKIEYRTHINANGVATVFLIDISKNRLPIW